GDAVRGSQERPVGIHSEESPPTEREMAHPVEAFVRASFVMSSSCRTFENPRLRVTWFQHLERNLACETRAMEMYGPSWKKFKTQETDNETPPPTVQFAVDFGCHRTNHNSSTPAVHLRFHRARGQQRECVRQLYDHRASLPTEYDFDDALGYPRWTADPERRIRCDRDSVLIS